MPNQYNEIGDCSASTGCGDCDGCNPCFGCGDINAYCLCEEEEEKEIKHQCGLILCKICLGNLDELLDF